MCNIKMSFWKKMSYDKLRCVRCVEFAKKVMKSLMVETKSIPEIAQRLKHHNSVILAPIFWKVVSLYGK